MRSACLTVLNVTIDMTHSLFDLFANCPRSRSPLDALCAGSQVARTVAWQQERIVTDAKQLQPAPCAWSPLIYCVAVPLLAPVKWLGADPDELKKTAPVPFCLPDSPSVPPVAHREVTANKRAAGAAW